MVYQIPIKTEEEIKIMREGGKFLGKILHTLKDMSKEGLDIWDLEERFLEYCQEHEVVPACKNYQHHGFPPFPAGLCISVNEQAVHCYPERDVKLKEGDLVTIDTVIKHNGLYLDSAVSFGIGDLDENKARLLRVTKNALDESIKVVKPGIRVGLISNTMQKIVEGGGFSVLVEYAGHGIGKNMHEPPEIPCFGEPTQGAKLKKGMTLAIEPLVCEKSNILEHKNHWKTKTVDKGNFAQFEHTVLVTDNGYEILTE